MDITPYLSFDGRCEEALTFYAKVLGGKTSMLMTWGESPMGKDAPPDWGKKVIHATFELDGKTIGASDSPPGYYKKPQGFSVTLDLDKEADAERVFKALAEKG